MRVFDTINGFLKSVSSELTSVIVTSYVKCEYRVYLMLSDLRRMSGVSLSDANQAYWQEVSKKCNKAVVFIENSAAEWYDDQLMPAFDTDHKLGLIVAPLLV